MAGGRDVAEEDVRDGGAALFAGVADPEDRVGERGVNGDRRAAEEHEHDRTAGLLQPLKELLLRERQLDAEAVAVEVGVDCVAFLALERAVDAEACDDGVRAPALAETHLARAAVGIGAERVAHLDRGGAFARALDDAFEDGDEPPRQPVVVADERLEIRGERADDVDVARARRVQRQERDAGLLVGRAAAAVERAGNGVLEEHDRLARGAERDGSVLGRVDVVRAEVLPRVFLRRIEQAEAGAGAQDAPQRAVDVFLRKESFAHGLHGGRERDAAIEVAAVLDRERGALGGRGADLVVLPEVHHGPAVAHDVAVEAPLAAEDVGKQQLRSAARFAVGAVVGAHDALDARLHDALELRQVTFAEVLLRRLRVKDVAVPLRAGVDGIVLRARGDLHVILRVVALHAAHVGRAHLAGEEGILAERLLAAAPARVAEEVDIRGPEREASVLVALPAGLAGEVELRARLAAEDRALRLREIAVERRREVHRLREDRRAAVAADAVQAFAPPVVGGQAEPRDRGGVVDELGALLLQRHPRDQFFDARVAARPEFFVRHGMVGWSDRRIVPPVARGGHSTREPDRLERETRLRRRGAAW